MQLAMVFPFLLPWIAKSSTGLVRIIGAPGLNRISVVAEILYDTQVNPPPEPEFGREAEYDRSSL